MSKLFSSDEERERLIEIIVRRVIEELENSEAQVAESEPEPYKPTIQAADESHMNDFMAAMDANLQEQENPKVGIFWYSPKLKDVFGVVSVDAQAQAQIEQRNSVSCKELHKYVWKKQYNYYKYHGGSDLYVGDYKYTPRGRVFFLQEENEYDIMVGSWINEHLEAIDKIKAAFNLTDPALNVQVKTGIHWEIGMGYGE